MSSDLYHPYQYVYRAPSELFIDGEVIYSQEGTTQGDQLAMPMYAVATIPLIKKLPETVTQVWYLDDASALGSITNLRQWWDVLLSLGSSYGYNPNPSKTWLVTKREFLTNERSFFEGSNINVTSVSRHYLGAALGTPEYVNQFVTEKVDQWSNELKLLSAVATTQPHAAYAVFTHGFSSKMVISIPHITKSEQTLSTPGEHHKNRMYSCFNRKPSVIFLPYQPD